MACRGVLTIGAEASAQATAVLTVAGTTSVRWRVLIRDVTDPVSVLNLNVHDETPNSATTVRTLWLEADRSEAWLGYYPDGPTTVDTYDTSGLDFSASVWVEVQIDADGTAHAKLWQLGDAVPGVWLLEGDVDATAGGVQSTLDTFKLYAGGIDGTTDIRDLRVWVDDVEVTGVFEPAEDASDWTGLSTDDITWTSSVTGDSVAEIVCDVSYSALGVWIDWDGDGFGTGDYDDVTANAMSWVIRRGSGAEITGGSQPGSATVVLKNPADIYNPRNAGSPLTGLIRDGLAIWIGVADDGTFTGSGFNGLFGGRVTDVTLIPAGGATESPTVEFVCEDALGWYSRTPVTLDYSEGRSHGQLREGVLNVAGETRYTPASETATMPLSHADGSLLSILDAINAVNGSRHYAKPEDVLSDWYTYLVRNRQWRLDGTIDASIDAGTDHVTGTDGWRLSADTVTNRQKATVTPVVFTPATYTVWEASPLPIALDDTHPYTVIVDFDNYVAGASLDLASTGDPVISTFTPFATGGKVELSVGAGDSASVTALSIEGRLARFQPSESYEANDTTSQAAPRGIRAGSEIGNEYIGSLAAATGIAEHVTWRYGEPQFRPTMTVVNWFPDQFQRDLYDILGFTSTQLDQTAVLFEIVGLTHTGNIAADTVQHHVTDYVLQECKVQADPGWFILDTSLLDSADILAY